MIDEKYKHHTDIAESLTRLNDTLDGDYPVVQRGAESIDWLVDELGNRDAEKLAWDHVQAAYSEVVVERDQLRTELQEAKDHLADAQQRMEHVA